MADITEGRNTATLTEQLNGFVADTYVLLGKTQSFHWNVTGPQFVALHKLFEDQYEDLFKAVDEVAERVRALDALAPTGLRDMLDRATLTDNRATPDAMAMVRALLADHHAMSDRAADIAAAAEEAEDLVTADLMNDRGRAHDKAAWMLKAVAS